MPQSESESESEWKRERLGPIVEYQKGFIFLAGPERARRAGEQVSNCHHLLSS